MTIRKIQVCFENGSYVSIWTGIISEMQNIWFLINNLNVMQVKVEEEGYASLLCQELQHLIDMKICIFLVSTQ